MPKSKHRKKPQEHTSGNWWSRELEAAKRTNVGSLRMFEAIVSAPYQEFGIDAYVARQIGKGSHDHRKTRLPPGVVGAMSCLQPILIKIPGIRNELPIAGLEIAGEANLFGEEVFIFFYAGGVSLSFPVQGTGDFGDYMKRANRANVSEAAQIARDRFGTIREMTDAEADTRLYVINDGVGDYPINVIGQGHIDDRVNGVLRELQADAIGAFKDACFSRLPDLSWEDLSDEQEP